MATDMLTAYEEGRGEALDLIIEGQLATRAEIVRPAIGREQSPEEQLAGHQAFETDRDVSLATGRELQARFQLKPEKPIPIRFVYRAILANEALEKASRDGVVKSAKRLGPAGFSDNGAAQGSLEQVLVDDGTDRSR